MQENTNVLTFFYSCCHLPITLIDENYNIISKEGFIEELNLVFLNSNILHEIKLNNSIKSPLKFNCKNNTNFIIFPHSINQKYYYIIGPYILENNLDKSSFIPVLNRNCEKYIEKLLLSILNDNEKEINSISPHIERLIELIESNRYDSLCISSICTELNMNQCYFCRLFKNETGLTFTQYVNNYRVEKSKKLLETTNLSLLDIALDVGFGSQSYFSTVFKKVCGMSPLDYKQSIK